LDRLRVGSMPGVAKFMEESGLSADYYQIGEKCKKLEPIFNRAIAAEVEFSTGHKCHFDLPVENKALVDDGILHPERAGTPDALSNLPAGEVFCVPNENEDSGTNGELPQKIGDEVISYVVKNNRIVDVKGSGPEAGELRERFASDRGWQNIAEFAIGVNDKARVTGIVLEDEKAGFHWAYGRSDHFGGQCGVAQFNSPAEVVHQDVVYAKESPITCKTLDFIFPDGTRQTLIVDGELQV
jgi:leucyl aminopeptidase (aminopeptidase T)